MFRALFQTFNPPLYSAAVVGIVAVLDLCELPANFIIVGSSAITIAGGVMVARRLFSEYC